MIVAIVVLAGKGLGLGRGREVLARKGADFVGERLVFGLSAKSI